MRRHFNNDYGESDDFRMDDWTDDEGVTHWELFRIAPDRSDDDLCIGEWTEEELEAAFEGKGLDWFDENTLGEWVEDRIADEFLRIVREWCGPEQCAEIDRRNATSEYAYHGHCASHDFCDPNQAMIDALTKFEITYDAQCDALGLLIDDVWGEAKRKGFAVKVPS